MVSGKNCPGKDCGATGVIFKYLGAGPVRWEESPGVTYIGHFRDIDPKCKGGWGGKEGLYMPSGLGRDALV